MPKLYEVLLITILLLIKAHLAVTPSRINFIINKTLNKLSPKDEKENGKIRKNQNRRRN